MFQIWAPKLHKHYQQNLQTIWKRHPDLDKDRPFPENSVYPSCTFNLGPAQSTKHLDPQNLPYGWCDIAALGDYDPSLGGHLILWDLNVIIQFPPGAHILLPSAILYHSCTTIQEGEMRHSFTQYCAGGLFRWVDAGCELVSELEGEKKEEFEKKSKEREEMGFSLFSRLDDLKLGQN